MKSFVLFLLLAAVSSTLVTAIGSNFNTCSFVPATANWTLVINFPTTDACRSFSTGASFNSAIGGSINAYAVCSSRTYCVAGSSSSSSNNADSSSVAHDWVISDESQSLISGFNLRDVSNQTASPSVGVLIKASTNDCGEVMRDPQNKNSCQCSYLRHQRGLLLTGNCPMVQLLNSYSLVKMFAWSY